MINKRFIMKALITIIGLIVVFYVNNQFLITLIISISMMFYADNAKSLENYEKSYIYKISLFYFFISILIKLNYSINLIPYSWRIFNIIEHTLTSTILSIFFIKIFSRKGILLSIFMTISIVLILGIFNEIFEFIIRLYLLDSISTKGDLYYIDTIIDFCSNLLGIITGIFFTNKFYLKMIKLIK